MTQAEQFEAAAASSASTYKDIVAALGPNFEGGYFLYRFSDPTFVVADAVVRAVAGTVLRSGGRALDVCGGSGHLTRALVPLSSPAPVLADLFFPKIWLARRFTAPGAMPVCCDGNVAAAVRARLVRLRDVLRRVHVHLDEAAVRRARCSARSTARERGTVADQSHAQSARLEPLAWAGADAVRHIATCSRRRRRASSASRSCSPMSSTATRWISSRAETRWRSRQEAALTLIASPRRAASLPGMRSNPSPVRR